MPTFKLPDGWYRDTIVELVDAHLPQYLGPLTAATAWRYVYAIALWTEDAAGVTYLHLNHRLSSAGGKALSNRGTDYLRANLLPGGVANPFPFVDFIGRRYAFERVQQGFAPPKGRDPNITGAALEVALQVIIGRISGHAPAREPLLSTLNGFELAPDGYHSRPDLALFGVDDFRLLISTKWALRKERIGTYLHEAYFYKRRRPDLQVAFVVSEFNPNILFWLANDPLVDRVYHVSKAMLLAVHEPFPRVAAGDAVPKDRLLGESQDVKDYARWLNLRERVFDLSQLFADIETLKPTPLLDNLAVEPPEADELEAETDLDEADT